MKKQKGLSPVIATVLLIVMVIAIGIIIFLWFRGFTQEAITKFGGTNVELVCQDVSFQSDYVGGDLFVSNTGNVPIYDLKIRVESPGGHETLDLSEIASGWPETGLTTGGAFSGHINTSASAEELTIIPVLRGRSGTVTKTHTCDEQYGDLIIL